MPFELDEMMEQKQRRERIATACMQGLLDNPYRDEGKANDYAELAVFFADALITELDKPRANGKLCVGCNRFVTDGARRMADASRYDYEQELAELIADGAYPFDKGAIKTDELEAYCRNNNIGGSRGGRSDALRRAGWHPYRAQKKIGGRNITTRFYAPHADLNLSPAALYDWYEQTRVGKQVRKGDSDC